MIHCFSNSSKHGNYPYHDVYLYVCVLTNLRETIFVDIMLLLLLLMCLCVLSAIIGSFISFCGFIVILIFFAYVGSIYCKVLGRLIFFTLLLLLWISCSFFFGRSLEYLTVDVSLVFTISGVGCEILRFMKKLFTVL